MKQKMNMRKKKAAKKAVAGAMKEETVKKIDSGRNPNNVLRFVRKMKKVLILLEGGVCKEIMKKFISIRIEQKGESTCAKNYE